LWGRAFLSTPTFVLQLSQGQSPMEYNITFSGSKLQELEISKDSVPGLTSFWQFVRGLMSRRKNAALTFKSNMSQSIGGNVSLISNCNIVVLKQTILLDGKLHFEKFEDAVSFIHELCHWIHFNYLDCKYSSGNPLAGKKADIHSKSFDQLFHIELEAWNLSRKFGKLYHFSTELLAEIDQGNSKNMYYVLKENGRVDSAFVEENPELTYEDYFLDENGMFHLPKLGVPIEEK
jgi:hypothetical protein